MSHGIFLENCSLVYNGSLGDTSSGVSLGVIRSSNSNSINQFDSKREGQENQCRDDLPFDTHFQIWAAACSNWGGSSHINQSNEGRFSDGAFYSGDSNLYKLALKLTTVINKKFILKQFFGIPFHELFKMKVNEHKNEMNVLTYFNIRNQLSQ